MNMASRRRPLGQPNEWKRGWKTVASSSTGVFFMTSFVSVTGIVMGPLVSEFGWPRSLIMSNALICSILVLLLAPAAGSLITRLGPRRFAMFAILAAVPGLLLIALAGGNVLTWLGAWIIFGAINVGLTPLLWMTAVVSLFERSRGLAIALTLSGSGAAYFFCPPFAFIIVEQFGWRAVYVSLAALLLVVQLPLVLIWFLRPGDLDQGQSASNSGDAQAGEATGRTMREALRLRQFWQFAILSVLVGMAEGALTLHLYPILNEGGLPAASAAWIVSLFGGALIVGRILSGILFDLVPPHHVLTGSIGLILIASVFAWCFAGGPIEGVTISSALGLGAGGIVNALAYLTPRYFGMKAYTSIFGMLMGAFSTAFGISPVVAGYLRDSTGNYASIFGTLVAALATALMLSLFLGSAGRLATAPSRQDAKPSISEAAQGD